MQKPKSYNLTPARGQALLNFQGRIIPKTLDVFEADLTEEVKQNGKKKQLTLEEKQKELNSDFRNLLIQGDCLSACAYLKSKDIKIDLVYIDPPFASGANYAKKIYLRNGNKESVENEDTTIGEEIMYGDIWQKEDYLNWLYERLLAIRDVMSEKASIYVHLDWHIGHYVKLLLDEVFGEENFLNEIVWHYENKFKFEFTQSFNNDTESIYLYAKNKGEHIFHHIDIPVKEKRKQNKVTWDPEAQKMVTVKDAQGNVVYYDSEEKIVGTLWNIPRLNSMAGEREEYSTQKPGALLERVIRASSGEGMIIADFFVGSGTTAKVANDLSRKFVACDIGINAIQTTRDRLVEAGAEFDVLKILDGVRLFRNPAQTTAKIFSLIDGFKTRTELGLGEFWDGGIVDDKGNYVPVKFIAIHDRLTKELLDVLLEEIYQLQDVAGTLANVKVIYAHKDSDIDQAYINKQIKGAGKTTVEVDLLSLDELLGEKTDQLFMPDNAEIDVTNTKDGCKVQIKQFFSPYLKAKIDEFNSKKVKKGEQISIENEEGQPQVSKKPVAISDKGLELIEAVQFDTTLRKDGVWVSNTELEDKARIKDKIKAIYELPGKKFKIKIRNIAGDEIIIDSEKLHK